MSFLSTPDSASLGLLSPHVLIPCPRDSELHINESILMFPPGFHVSDISYPDAGIEIGNNLYVKQNMPPVEVTQLGSTPPSVVLLVSWVIFKN